MYLLVYILNYLSVRLILCLFDYGSPLNNDSQGWHKDSPQGGGECSVRAGLAQRSGQWWVMWLAFETALLVSITFLMADMGASRAIPMPPSPQIVRSMQRNGRHG